jgi:tripartite motif-containing protein 71
LAAIGSAGSGDGQFNYPQNIAIDANGNLYVADTGNNRIEKFDTNGVYLSQFGSFGSGNGQFNYPVGLAFDLHGHVYVSDVANNRIQKFDPEVRS